MESNLTAGSIGQLSSLIEKQSLGAETAAGKPSGLNRQAAGSASFGTDKQTFGAQVVAKTLDALNQPHEGRTGGSAEYQFQKDVLGAYMSGRGALADAKA